MSQSKRPDIPLFDTPLVETHCHLDYLEYTELDSILARCRQVGIERIVTIAVSPGNLDKVRRLAADSDMIWCTQGIHPHEAESYDRTVEQKILEGAADQRTVAIGEIGLDYYYDHADRRVQRAVFERQLQLAVDCRLPVVIHTREADDDTRAVLANFSDALAGNGVIHSFTSSPALAEFCLAEGFMLGFNGITTFKRADNVREVVALTPVQQLVLETDAPYLTPVPYRGKPNAPYYLRFIAQQIATVLAMPVEQLLAQAYRNSERLFFTAL